MRRRVGPPPSTSNHPQDEDSSSDEDVFSKLARKEKKQKTTNPSVKLKQEPQQDDGKPAAAVSEGTASQVPNPSLPLPTTSSMKRHHKELSDSRKAKMDALLQELEQEKKKIKQGKERGFVPAKKGSYVDPEDEHVTTNIFVGNLAPTLTEEEVTALFRQFGDLYSVKIMWPRTAEERARDRHTGFVCFMNRQDAEDAMMSCDNADPFNVGRPLVLRWGKHVQKINKVGGVAPIEKRALPSRPSSSQPAFDPQKHGRSAITVSIPKSKDRVAFISIVASYVAKDGSALEQLLENEGNPRYDFLRLPYNPTEEQREEHIYYRWRVYSFAQGDGFFVWRSEPFCMFRPHGCFWIPPPMDEDAAQQELDHKRQRENLLRRQKEERVARRDYVTGRQLERARKGGPHGDGRLTRDEMEEFHELFRQNLNASRESICVAMAFCFEKSGAARQIADLLKELLLEDGAAVETRIARLYLLSDILFNSQQPGIRNAFLYRDAIERFAPDIFTKLSKSSGDIVGRISQNKLTTAVSRVLSAWTSWSVYPPLFLDQLQSLYEGKEIAKTEDTHQEGSDDGSQNQSNEIPVDIIAPNDADLVSTRRKGEWKDIDEDHKDESFDNSRDITENQIDGPDQKSHSVAQNADHRAGLDGHGSPPTNNDDIEVDGESIDGDVIDEDGDPLEDDGEAIDGEPIDSEGEAIDGEPMEEDGEPLLDRDVS